NAHGIAVASVVKVVRPEGNVYRITFSGTGDQPELVPDSSGLTPRSEKQTIGVYNANGGTFTLTFPGRSGPTHARDFTALASTVASTPQAKLTAGVTVAVSSTVTGIYEITFGGTSGANTDVNEIIADDSNLVGALDNGKLVGDVNFTGSIYNGPSVVVVTT